jgi:hypothetical protein
MSHHDAPTEGLISALNDACERLGVATQRADAARALLQECQSVLAPEHAALLARIAAHLAQG